MPIFGWTDRGASFPKIGVIRKGAPKPKTGNRPGADLEHFRFDTGDERAGQMFAAAYGLEPREINVYFPHATPEENFQTWQEEYTASSLKHRCDGQTCVLWLDEQTGKYQQTPKPCPGGCKATGRLSVIIPELQRFAYVTVGTTSVHDIMRITENLEAYFALRGDLRGIPFVLKRTPEMISTPGDKGRVRREKWLLSVEALPEWVHLQLQGIRQQALEQKPMALLTVNPQTGEIVGGAEIEADFDDYEDEPIETVTPVTVVAPATNGNGNKPELPFAVGKGVHENAVAWAMKQGCYNAPQHAQRSYKNHIEDMGWKPKTGDDALLEMLTHWVAKVNGKLLAQAEPDLGTTTEDDVFEDTEPYDDVDAIPSGDRVPGEPVF